MKTVKTVGAAIVALALTLSAASAQRYPWCAIVHGGDSLTRNCSFTSYEQCLPSALDGYCTKNVW